MHNCSFIWRTWLLASLLAATSAGMREALGQDGLSPLDKALWIDAADGSLDQFDLPMACLIAGGVSDPDELADPRQRLVAVCQSIASPCQDLPREERARAIFERMHAQVLVGRYDRAASDLRKTLAGGDFNCLSALVVYHGACRQAGVQIELYSRPGHVFCTAGQPAMRIEPTCRDWVTAPARADECTRLCLKRAIKAGVAGVERSSTPAAGGSLPLDPSHPHRFQTEPSAPQPITELQLVGRFYYNRGRVQLDAEQFADCAASLQIACALDPQDGDARANLQAAFNNWALAKCAQADHAAAAALIGRGLALDPTFPPLVANERYVRDLLTQPSQHD